MYSTYEFLCNKPKGYHRYQSNLCDPQQDHLPITFPKPFINLPEINLKTPQDKIICNLKYGYDPPNRNCNCEEY